MKKQIEITDELKKELGNAIAAYGDLLHKAYLGVSIPLKFKKLNQCSTEELYNKMHILRKFYDSL